MLDGIPPVVLGGSPWALIAVVVLLIYLGRLVPRSVLEDVRNDREIRLAEVRAERDDWKAAAVELRQQNGLLLEQGKSSLKLLRSLPTPEVDP